MVYAAVEVPDPDTQVTLNQESGAAGLPLSIWDTSKTCQVEHILKRAWKKGLPGTIPPLSAPHPTGTCTHLGTPTRA